MDRKFAEKVKDVFPYVFGTTVAVICSALELIRDTPGVKGIQYDMPYYGQEISWPKWCEQVAKMLRGKACAMNAPTTQVACHGSADEVRRMVGEFIEATLPTPPPASCRLRGGLVLAR